MSCSVCGGDCVAFAVPPSLRPYSPDDSSQVTLCTTCLRVDSVDENDETVGRSPAVDWGPLPTGDAGVATALLLGLLDSLALRRADVTALVDAIEHAGGDPFLTLDRLVELAAAGDLDPHIDLTRRAAQLESFVD